MFEFTETVNWLLAGSGAGLCAALAGTSVARRMRSTRDREMSGFLDHMSIGYYRSTLDGKQLMANPALVSLNGYDTQEQLLEAVEDIALEWYVDPHRRAAFKAQLQRHGTVENFVSEIYRHGTRERIWIEENARVVTDREGRPLYYEGTVRECSDTIRLTELEARHRKFSQQVPGALFTARWSADNGFSIPYRTAALSQLLGAAGQTVEDDAQHLFSILHPHDYRSFVTAGIASVETLSQWEHSFRIRPFDGEERWLLLKATPEMEAEGACLWHGFIMDITEEKRAERKIYRLAYHDQMTGLPNRQRFKADLKIWLSKPDPSPQHSALLVIDLDGLKAINEARGHDLGDEVIKAAGARIAACCPPSTLVSRFGSDEFGVLVEEAGADAQAARDIAARIARCICDSVSAPVAKRDELARASCSVGVTVFKRETASASTLLAEADGALAQAKLGGGGRVRFFDAQLRDRMEEKAALLSELENATTARQFILHYQPQVDRDGRVSGAEALLRWQHPQRGLIMPDRFIAEAEESGLIGGISDFVLEEAARTLTLWGANAALRDLQLSINISAREFNAPTFVERVSSVIDRYDFKPQRLTLEMTEHVLAGDLTEVKRSMTALRNLGVKFSLDDFGTGYSSLVNLRELPFDEVKIDGSFVKNAPERRHDRSIVRSIIALADAMEMTSVAEWVETPAHRDFLMQEGCGVMQGYLYGKPLPLGEFERALASDCADKRLSA